MRLSAMLSVLGWAALGFAGGVLGHYVLYRVGLPLQPFIYVSF